jgi:hypothetical protein
MFEEARMVVGLRLPNCGTSATRKVLPLVAVSSRSVCSYRYRNWVRLWIRSVRSNRKVPVRLVLKAWLSA